MSSLKLFHVSFDRSNATYMPGETVSGNIIIEAVKDKVVRGLYYTTKGISYVRWTVSEPLDKSKNRNYTNSEGYYHFKYNIFGTLDPDSRYKLPSGYNQYPFSFQLPANIPCSFEHANGYIRYTVKAVIDRPWKFDHECKATFTVVSVLDLNLYRELYLKISNETKKTFTCFCQFGQGSINLKITVPSFGYIPGQTINATLMYINSSTIKITKIGTKLLRKLKFCTSSKTLTTYDTIRNTSHIEPSRRFGEVTSELLVPSITPSYLRNCSIIKLDYELVVSVHVMGPSSKTKRCYPILIGTIPLYCSYLPPLYNHVRSSSSTPMIPVLEQFNPPQFPIVRIKNPANSSSRSLVTLPSSYTERMPGTQGIGNTDESDSVVRANTQTSPRNPVLDYPIPSISEKMKDHIE